MTIKADLVPEETIALFHPDLQRAVRAVNTEEIQEIMRQLGKYGLAVALPHMHTGGVSKSCWREGMAGVRAAA